MMNTPKVSIVIPVFNGSNYIGEAIDSALCQTYKNCEVIVVNDGSNDNNATRKICISYGSEIRYFEKENGGVASAVNFGISKMGGEYFSWLSHDDVYYPEKVRKQIEEIQKSGDITSIVHSNYDLLNANTEKITHVKQEKIYDVEQLTNSVFSVLVNTIHGSTILLHKSYFERYGVFNESLYSTQDYDLFFRIMRGKKSRFISESLVKIRLHNEATRNSCSSFEKSYSDQYIGFLDELSVDELLGMKIEPICFYYKISGIVKIRDTKERSIEVLEKIKSLPKPREKTTEFIDILNKLSNESFKYIFIFGAGFHGRLLNYELKGRGLEADGFLDNDVLKQGNTIDELACVTISELYDRKNEVLIVVSPEDCEDIINQLHQFGFLNVITKKQLEQYFLRYAPTYCEEIKNEVE